MLLLMNYIFFFTEKLRRQAVDGREGTLDLSQRVSQGVGQLGKRKLGKALEAGDIVGRQFINVKPEWK
jgi:hypothetical protein